MDFLYTGNQYLKANIILIISYCVFSCSKDVKSDKETIVDILNGYQNSQSISYDIDYQMNFFNGDSINITAQVDLIKEKIDTIFGGYIWYKAKNQFRDYDKYYNLDYIFDIDNDNGIITSYNAHNGQDFIITGNSDKALKNTYFFNPQMILDLIQNDSLEISKIRKKHDKIIELEILPPDKSPYSNMSTTLFFDLEQHKLKKKITTVDFQGSTQSEVFIFNNIRFNKVKVESLDKRFKDISNDYPTIKFIPKSREDYSLLDNKTIAPEIVGNTFLGGLDFSLKEELQKHELIVIDFWYMSCLPCIEAIPKLNSIYLKYKDKGLMVIGLNPFDSEKSKEKMETFLSYNTMEYPSFFVDYDILKKYKVNAYPTLYVIDKNENIIYSKIGISDDTFTKLDSVVGLILNK